MSNRPVTIRDVASQAGVAESTVSRVLSGRETTIPISAETRARVLRAAQELGYRPHPSALALRGNRTHLLGLIVREIDDPFFAQLIEVISSVAKAKGYGLVLGYAESDPEEALALREIMLDLRYCDGLFLLGDLKESPSDRTFLAEMGKDHQIVSVCRGSQQLLGDTPSVAVDNRKGALMALDYLTQLGHQRIAHISAQRLGDMRERMETYRAFMQERFADLPEDYVQFDENSYQGGYQAAARLLSLPAPPTAIFATDDTMAVGAMSAIADAGLLVPGDVSVIGFDDIKVGGYLRPALTTIGQSTDKLGEKAVELLLSVIGWEVVPHPLPRFLIEPKLVVRGSCAPPAVS